MPAYSLEAVPYRWTNRELAFDVAETWGIRLEPELEDAADSAMGWSSSWLQDRRNQLRMLDSFFSAVQPNRSLVFIYAKDVPLLEDRQPGTRVLVGVGRVTQPVDPSVEWSYAEPPAPGQLRSVLWERAVHHSIRPDFQDGFLLPYQALLSDPHLAGEDLSRFVALAPAEAFNEFSYVWRARGARRGHCGSLRAREGRRPTPRCGRRPLGPGCRVALRSAGRRLGDAWALPWPGFSAGCGRS